MKENCFLHLMVFADAFKTSRQSKNKGHEVIFFSTAEFDTDECWDHVNQASIAPLIVYNKNSKTEMNPNTILSLFTNGFVNLSRGIDIGNIRVFGYLSAVLGDMPGRCELGMNKCLLIVAGLKNPALAFKLCHLCDITNKDLVTSFHRQQYPIFEQRSELDMRIKAQCMGDGTHFSEVQKVEGQKNGFTHCTGNVRFIQQLELLKYPGFEFTQTITYDMMHGGIQGEYEKHLVLYMRKISKE
jgi:hypothetical protein